MKKQQFVLGFMILMVVSVYSQTQHKKLPLSAFSVSVNIPELLFTVEGENDSINIDLDDYYDDLSFRFECKVDFDEWRKYDKSYLPVLQQAHITLSDSEGNVLIPEKDIHKRYDGLYSVVYLLPNEVTADGSFLIPIPFKRFEVRGDAIKELTSILQKVSHCEIQLDLMELTYDAEFDKTLEAFEKFIKSFEPAMPSDNFSDAQLKQFRDIVTLTGVKEKYADVDVVNCSIDSDLIQLRDEIYTNIENLKRLYYSYEKQRYYGYYEVYESSELKVISFLQYRKLSELFGELEHYADSVAFPCLEASAMGGNSTAQLYMGMCYGAGQKCKDRWYYYDHDISDVSYEKYCIHWYAKAALNGNRQAEKRLNDFMFFLRKWRSPYDINKIILSSVALYKKQLDLNMISKKEYARITKFFAKYIY